MKSKWENSLSKAVLKLSGECVELTEELEIKYTLGGKEYTDKLFTGSYVDVSLIKNEQFRNDFFKLLQIGEMLDV